MALDDPIVLILFLVLLVLGIVLSFPNYRAKLIPMFGTFIALLVGLGSICVFHLFFGAIVFIVGIFLAIVFSKRSTVMAASCHVSSSQIYS